jgi:hypothetical protein
MPIIMNYTNIKSIGDIINFNKRTSILSFSINTRKERYDFVRTTLTQLRYEQLQKGDRTEVKKYIRTIAGYSKIQLKRLIQQWKKSGLIYMVRGGITHRKYTADDVALLIQTDIVHKTPNGLAVKSILMREYMMFGKEL